MEQTKTNTGALGTIITVFFFWGFVAASNGIFIPFCKSHFQLSQFQSQLIDFTFYGGYFMGSVILYLASQILKIDILNRIGYKNGIVIGLLLSVVGALANILPAIAAVLTIVWTAIRIWETDTIQSIFKRNKTNETKPKED
mgnify:CR=1 FL=1